MIILRAGKHSGQHHFEGLVIYEVCKLEDWIIGCCSSQCGTVCLTNIL